MTASKKTALATGTEEKRMLCVERLTEEQRRHLIDRVAKAFSDILSDQYECKVTWEFAKREKEALESDNSDTEQ